MCVQGAQGDFILGSGCFLWMVGPEVGALWEARGALARAPGWWGACAAAAPAMCAFEQMRAAAHLQVSSPNEADTPRDIAWVDVDDGRLGSNVDAPDTVLRPPLRGEDRLDLADRGWYLPPRRYSTARATVASGSVSNGFSCAELRQSDASVSGESLPRRDARVLVSAAPLVPGITAGRACKTVCLGSRGIEGQNARCTGTFSIKQVWGISVAITTRNGQTCEAAQAVMQCWHASWVRLRASNEVLETAPAKKWSRFLRCRASLLRCDAL